MSQKKMKLNKIIIASNKLQRVYSAKGLDLIIDEQLEWLS